MNTDSLWNHEWKLVTKLATACVYGVFAWGVIFYTDAPLKPCDNGQFCGKSRQHYSEQQYQAFRRWEAALVIAFVVAGICRLVELGLQKDREQAAERRQQERVARANAQDKLA